jgi:hypothetical protein
MRKHSPHEGAPKMLKVPFSIEGHLGPFVVRGKNTPTRRLGRRLVCSGVCQSARRDTFSGSIHPEQFTIKEGHQPTNIMDPYND